MHLQWYSKWFWSAQQNTQHCMNGEADNSRMYVYLHLAFKELKDYTDDYTYKCNT